MQGEQAYNDLTEHMRNWLFGLPESDILPLMLGLRFSPEEAAFLARFPHMPHTMEQLSEKLGIPPERLSETMQPMIRKGLIYEVEGKRVKPKDEKHVVYNPDRCIGCGVCAHNCPTQSLRLDRIDQEQDYPLSMGDAGRRMLAERGRDFSKIY